MRFVTWPAGVVWIGAWYLMYLELTRWQHVKRALDSTPPPLGER